MKKISALAVAGVFVASLAGTVFAEGTDVKVSGEIRLRDEIKNNTDFKSSTGDHTMAITQRTRVNVDAKVDERVKAYVSLENNRNFGSNTNSVTFTDTTGASTDGTLATKGGNSTTIGNGSDTVSLYQGYVVVDKLFDQPLMFKAGRTKIALGNQRLAGANDWGAGQAFDSLILGYNVDAVSVTGFSLTAADNQSSVPTAGQKKNAYLNGIYATIKSVPVTGIDVYAIQKQDVAVDESFITYGVRANGAAMNIDWDAELALQSGDTSKTLKKNASALWLVAGYSMPQVSKLRIGAEYDQISGDKSGGDDEAFDKLYFTKHSTSQQHSVYGITDIVEGTTSKANGLKAMSLNVSAEPVEGLKLLAEYWNFTSAESMATGKTGVGSEMNLQVWYGITKSANLHAYYAAFTPSGEYSANTDAATDAVLQLQVAF